MKWRRVETQKSETRSSHNIRYVVCQSRDCLLKRQERTKIPYTHIQDLLGVTRRSSPSTPFTTHMCRRWCFAVQYHFPLTTDLILIQIIWSRLPLHSFAHLFLHMISIIHHHYLVSQSVTVIEEVKNIVEVALIKNTEFGGQSSFA